LITLILCFSVDTKATDFGYNLGNDETCAVWWAEGTYKIMQKDPAPDGKVKPVKLYSAANEYESIQIVLLPHKALDNFQLKTSDFKSESGSTLSSTQITIRKVEYIHVIRPTDSYGKPGWYPDQLPVLDKPLALETGRNHPFFITVYIPKGTTPGDYKGSIRLVVDGWEKEIPVELQVWNFTLPDNTSIRSSFGISTENIRNYHNLESEEELKKVTDKYFAVMRDYKIGPTNPFSLHPMEVIVDGLNWTGGIFSDKTVVTGKKALKVTDNDVESNIEAHTNALIEVDPSETYLFTWYVKTAVPDQKYCVLLRCYDADQQVLPFENRLEEFLGQDTWDADTLKIRPFRDAIKYVTIHLFPVFKTNSGNNTGSGSFYQQRRGVFQGFAQGTAEYDYLMKKYLTIVQNHLEEMGWLGKDYVYWFDEPNTENYPFVREGMEIIHTAAPKITRFITEHQPGPDIMDVTEISCTVIGQLDPVVIKDLVEQGREFWSYVCCCPKAPYLSLFIDHDAINMRMWLWLSYKFQMKGILVWSANYWNSRTASPQDYLQNPWEDPMSYTVGYGLPYGKQNGWGNGDGRYLYPPNRNPNDHSKKYLEGPIPCLRLENIRDGVEDYEYLLLLEEVAGKDEGGNKRLIKEARQLLSIPESIVVGPTDYNKDPQSIIQYRIKIGKILDKLN
jgi:hypothetical protein